ncbi:uncharacterized protein YL-1 [Lepeophtheirus salmonis]|nr:uncharacterized protein LOC121128927 [Lepeophtheirus salmonis]
MSKSRPRRNNAGSKMAALLDEEERKLLQGDDFYSTTYGGFADEENDKEFHYESPVEDQVDSDFSIDENDELRSDIEDDEQTAKRPKRAQGVQTKAYKEPPRKPKEKKTPVQEAPKAPPPPPLPPPKVHLSDFSIDRRASTINKSAETVKRVKERAALARRRLKKMQKNKKPEPAPLTQEEILEECKLTEKLNIESLKKFQEMEMENRKKAKSAAKRKMDGPFIRYHSIATPLIEEITSDTKKEDSTSKTEPLMKQKQERTFITFSELEVFNKTFPKKKPIVNTSNTSQKICPITRLPAKYFDPVTRLPYANLQAFRILREAYYNQLEAKGDRSDPEIAAWVEWRQKNRSASKQSVINQVNRPPPVFSQLLSSVNRQNSVAVQPQQPSVQQPQQPTQQPQLQPTVIQRPIVVSAQQIITTNTLTPTSCIQAGGNVVALQVASASSSGHIIRQQTHSQTLQQTQQQSIVLPVRTTALTPQLQSSSVTIPNSNIQTVKIGGQTAQVSWSGNTLQLPRTVATTTLTAQQLQQLAASRGQVLTSALHTALRTGSLAQRGGTHLIATRPGQQTTLLRPQQQGVRQAPTIALQRPVRAQTISLQPATGRAAGQIIMGQAVTSASNVSSPGRQIVVAAGAGGTGTALNSSRQIVMTHGGQQVRQVLQVTGQGGQQHQIVVSQGGQIILNPPNSKS